jgi:hypothetical protein
MEREKSKLPNGKEKSSPLLNKHNQTVRMVFLGWELTGGKLKLKKDGETDRAPTLDESFQYAVETIEDFCQAVVSIDAKLKVLGKREKSTQSLLT